MVYILNSMETQDLINREQMNDIDVISLSFSQPNLFEIIVSRYQQPFLHKIQSIVKNRRGRRHCSGYL